jgi:hypothetical protein
MNAGKKHWQTLPPLTVPCEGSGAPGHLLLGDAGLCTMCGHAFDPDDNGAMPAHDRLDIIAMINRGDFDA